MYLNTVFKYNVFKYCPALDWYIGKVTQEISYFTCGILQRGYLGGNIGSCQLRMDVGKLRGMGGILSLNTGCCKKTKPRFKIS